ncbi:LUD domain-containing protein [Capnocytophaga canimorsus]|uniref:LUD domain-containing protein n=1 Tax=Capnocytophaga canimorsus TaxID=28188 RepID=UPI000BB174A2|nr:LUD domain-containing protein [Capnocytophaga canimorsus]ATA77769.1 hypothetical protein CGC47_09355 [Capnocytophaga canimorsus]PJI76598.1 YkgG family uncharacterized protein [Capnocytophaga canimorsus]GIM58970.1 hypothetical protein CAPN007_11780 [Capnocytophaga canimorsus]STA73057.1 Uncharacterised ACR, YkgG family COG1556 [Capnocytophaga canimorsus]
MSFFKKIFGSRNETSKSKEERGKYAPAEQKKISADECFAIKFVENGGKFIYCESEIEIQQIFVNIIREIGIDARIATPSQQLVEMFGEFESLFVKNVDKANIYLTDCEYLLTDKGAILFSSNQLRQKKMKDLPKIFIVFAKTSQMVLDISEGMRGIKNKYRKKIPSGITALHNFKESQDDFLTYGTCSKKMYLILLEDMSN